MNLLSKGDVVFLRYPVSITGYSLEYHIFLLQLEGDEPTDLIKWPASASPFNAPLPEFSIFLQPEHFPLWGKEPKTMEIQDTSYSFFFPDNFGVDAPTYYSYPTKMAENMEVTMENVLTIPLVQLYQGVESDWMSEKAVVDFYAALSSGVARTGLEVIKIVKLKSGSAVVKSPDLDIDVYLKYIMDKEISDTEYIALVRTGKNIFFINVEFLKIK